MKDGQARPAALPFALRTVFDGRITIDEPVRDIEELHRRLVKAMGCRNVAISWGFPDIDEMGVQVEWREGLAFSSWTCPDCGSEEQSWDSVPTPDVVLRHIENHWCSGSVTRPVDDETGSAAIAGPGADHVADARRLEAQEREEQAGVSFADFFAGVDALPALEAELELEGANHG